MPPRAAWASSSSCQVRAGRQAAGLGALACACCLPAALAPRASTRKPPTSQLNRPFLLYLPADETVYDAVLLLDRAMSVPLTLTPSTGPDGALAVAAAACLHVVATRQAALPAAPRLDAATVAQAAGVAPQALAAMQTRVMAALGGDTASVSGARAALGSALLRLQDRGACLRGATPLLRSRCSRLKLQRPLPCPHPSPLALRSAPLPAAVPREAGRRPFARRRRLLRRQRQ